MKKFFFPILLIFGISLFAQTTPPKPLVQSRGTLAEIPVGCELGQLYFATDQAAGSNVYGCDTGGNPGSWTLEGGGGGGGGTPGGSAGSVQIDKAGNFAGIIAFVLGTDDYLIGTPDSAHRDPAPMPFCTGTGVYFPYPACIPTQIFFDNFPNNTATGSGLDCSGFDTATCSQEPPADLIVKGIIQTVASGTYNTEWVVLDTGTNFVDNAELVSVTALGATVQWLHANSLSTPNVFSDQEAVVIDNNDANVRQISSNVTNVSMRHGTAFQAFGSQPTVGMDCGAGGTCNVTERMAGEVIAANGGANGLDGFLVGLDVIMTTNVKNTTLCAGSLFYTATSATTSTCGVLIDDLFGASPFSLNPFYQMGGPPSGTNNQLNIWESNSVFDGTMTLGQWLSASAVPSVSGSGAVLGAGSNVLGGTFTTTTTGAMTVTLTFPGSDPAPAHGYACNFSDRTTANLMRQTSTSTTTAVVQGASVAGDVIQYSGCTAY